MLTIGELARECGVPTSTIRFWERRGLIKPSARRGGQRRYTEEVRAEVALLRLCQDAGFTLAEIARLAEQRSTVRPDWRGVVRAKIVDVEEDLRRLHKAHDMLKHALDCPHPDITECPRFQQAIDHRLRPAAAPAGATVSGPAEPGP